MMTEAELQQVKTRINAQLVEVAQDWLEWIVTEHAGESKLLLDTIGLEIVAEVNSDIRGRGALLVMDDMDVLQTARSDVRLITAPLKGFGRAASKVACDYDGDWLAIKDLARITIAVRSYEDIDCVVEAIQKRFTAGAGLGVVELKITTAEQSPTGWSGTTVFVRTSASDVGEIQVNVLSLLYSKHSGAEFVAIFGMEDYNQMQGRFALPGGLGHILYERYREGSPDQAEFAALAQQYHAYFRDGSYWSPVLQSLREGLARHGILPAGS